MSDSRLDNEVYHTVQDDNNTQHKHTNSNDVWPSNNNSQRSSYQSTPASSHTSSVLFSDTTERLLSDSGEQQYKTMPILFPIARAITIQPRNIDQQHIDTLTAEQRAAADHFKYTLLFIAELQLGVNFLLVLSQYWFVSVLTLLILAAAYQYAQRYHVAEIRLIYTSIGLILLNAVKNGSILEEYIDNDNSMWQTLTMIALSIDVLMLLPCSLYNAYHWYRVATITTLSI